MGSPTRMRGVRVAVSLPILLAGLGLGCADGGASKPHRVAADPAPEVVLCTDPRPELCTMDYKPVCGHRCDEPPCGADARMTYSNGCGACSDAEVRGWTDGPCPEGA